MVLIKACFPMAFLFSIAVCFVVQNDVQILEIQLAECIASLARKTFPHDKLLVVQMPEFDCESFIELDYVDNLMQVLVKEMNYQTIISGCVELEGELKVLRLTTAVLVVVVPELNDDVELKKLHVDMALLNILVKHRFHDLQIVIISTGISTSVQQQEEIALNLINVALQTRPIEAAKLEVIVLIPEVGWSGSSNKNPDIDIFGWYPDKQDDPCFQNVNQVSILDRWISAEQGFLTNEELFPYKGFIHDSKCILIVDVVESFPYLGFTSQTENGNMTSGVVGIYHTILVEMSRHTNFDFRYSVNESRHDIEGPTQLSVSGFMGDYALSYPYFRQYIHCYVPVIEIQRWQGIIRVFSGPVWILVAIAFAMGMLILWLLEKYILRKEVSITESFLKTLRTYIAVGIPFDCRGVFSTAFFVLWLLYCMQVYTAFTSVLTSFLAFPGQYLLASTVEELRESSHEIWTNVWFDEVGNEIETWLMTSPSCDLHECFHKLIHDQNVGVIGDSYFFDMLIVFQNLFFEDGSPKIFRINVPVREYYLVMNFYNPKILEYFNQMMHRIMGSGIPCYILNMYFLFLKMELPDYDDGPKPITLSELQGPFYFLLGGLLIGATVFIAENIYVRKKSV